MLPLEFLKQVAFENLHDILIYTEAVYFITFVILLFYCQGKTWKRTRCILQINWKPKFIMEPGVTEQFIHWILLFSLKLTIHKEILLSR